MSNIQRKAIIVSVSSDIGTAMATRWLEKGWFLAGTYRTDSTSVARLTKHGVHMFHCNLSDIESVENACAEMIRVYADWDVLVLCPGSQDPVGAFESCGFDKWEDSVRVNFTSQLRILHKMLPYRNKTVSREPCVLFFAGGGTNNAVVNYSAYTVSKIALIKMCELLDAEITDARFAILGPGWVKTKIHDSTLKAGSRAGDNYQRTKHKLASNECTSMEDVLDCCDWIINAPRNIVSGRNFSVVFDLWGTDELSEKLANDQNMYKLRRHGNDWKNRGGRK